MQIQFFPSNSILEKPPPAVDAQLTAHSSQHTQYQIIYFFIDNIKIQFNFMKNENWQSIPELI